MMDTPAEAPLIIVVDDDEDHRRIAIGYLQDAGFRTIEAENAWIAEQMLFAHNPDVMVLDLHMPLKSGLQFFRDLSTARKATLPIIIYSSYADSYQAELDSLGLVAVVNKSERGPELVAKVRQLLAAR
jgi:DNA-binding response OmpR family regulator